jgi:diadenosine tetraphosphatase ApaH/serine/threonine PP2A family protein phosphatase
VLALLYDVHGNLPALEAVLADARADRYLLGGDYALFGPWPAETVARLRELENATWIRGNVDRWTALPEPEFDEATAAAISDCARELGPKVVAELGALPGQVVIDEVRYCHASPISDMRPFWPDPASEEEERELLAGATERRVVFGHTHLAFARTGPDGIELVNPGSVGQPWDGDHRAAYALIHGDGRLEHRRVTYDHERSAAAVRERFGDAAWAMRSERRLLSARFDP